MQMPTEPPPAERRLSSLDLARGIAILGILPANIATFSTPTSWGMAFGRIDSWADHAALLLTRVFVDGRFITLLSVLFGAGLALQIASAKAAGRAFNAYYVRRMGLLFLIGLLHGLLLWYGDILTSYAIVALGALLLSRTTQRALLWCAGGFVAVFYASLLFSALLFLVLGLFSSSTGFPGPPSAHQQPAVYGSGSEVRNTSAGIQPRPAYRVDHGVEETFGPILRYFSRENQVRVYRHGTYGEMVLDRAVYLGLTAVGFWTGLGLYLLGCFLAGMALARHGLFHDPDAHSALLRKLIVFGLAAATPLNLAAVAVYVLSPGGFLSLFSWCLGYLAAFPLALTYLAWIVLWDQSRRTEWLQSRVRAIGRLALSNYLLQSVICGFVFYGYGLGLYDQVGRAAALGIVVAIWVLQLSLSPIWLRHFQIGPVEWLWRSLAAGRRQPLRQG
jgi:uncharacterized protein